MTHPGGRPLKFQSPEELQQKITEYFTQCDTGVERDVVLEKAGKAISVIKISEPTPYTIEDLSLFLKVTPQTLWNYGKTEEFFEIITCAKAKIHASWIKGGLTNRFNNKMATQILAANNPNYRINNVLEVNVLSIEDRLRAIDQQNKPALPDPDTQDAEVVKCDTPGQDNTG